MGQMQIYNTSAQMPRREMPREIPQMHTYSATPFSAVGSAHSSVNEQKSPVVTQQVLMTQARPVPVVSQANYTVNPMHAQALTRVVPLVTRADGPTFTTYSALPETCADAQTFYVKPQETFSKYTSPQTSYKADSQTFITYDAPVYADTLTAYGAPPGNVATLQTFTNVDAPARVAQPRYSGDASAQSVSSKVGLTLDPTFAFKAMDRNSDGRITRAELDGAVVGAQVPSLPAADSTMALMFDPAFAFDAIDTNKDGQITRSEFAAAVRNADFQAGTVPMGAVQAGVAQAGTMQVGSPWVATAQG